MPSSWCRKSHFTLGSKTCFARISFKLTLYKNQPGIFWHLFGAILWDVSGTFRAILGPKWGQIFRWFSGHFGVRSYIGVTLKCFCYRFGFVLGSFWAVLVCFWSFRAVFAPFFKAKNRSFSGLLVEERKMCWDPVTIFWREHSELSIREGTGSNGHE